MVLWIKATRGRGALLSGANLSHDNEYSLFLEGSGSNTVKLQIKGNAISLNAPGIEDGNFHHLAWARRSDGANDLYLDGVFVGRGNLPIGPLVIDTNGLWLGQEQDCAGGCFDPSQAFSGLIDEVKIYNRALSDGDIKAIYDAGSVGMIETPEPQSGSPSVPTSSGWIPVDSMRAERSEHTATLLANGKVLIVGGETTVAELYNPATRAFNFIGNTNCNHGTRLKANLMADGRVLVTGGASDKRCAEVYDPETESFSRVGDLNADHFRHTATLLEDGNVLIAGGWQLGSGGHVTQAVAEIFDPEAATFSLTGSLNISRMLHTAALLPSGQVLVIGGGNNDSPNEENCAGLPEVYAPGTGTFSTIDGVPEICASHGTLLDNGDVLFPREGLRPAMLFNPSDSAAREG